MTAAPSARPDAARLRAELERASEQVAALEAEHEALLTDPGVIQEDRDAAAALLQHARHQLDTARAAVARLEDGSYGRCDRCGGEIGAERLAALVGVTTCVKCAG
ncbi:MAG: TraR/DksA family transcriptional regulator [Ilumatobacteraceae bacterium]